MTQYNKFWFTKHYIYLLERFELLLFDFPIGLRSELVEIDLSWSFLTSSAIQRSWKQYYSPLGKF